MTDITGQNKAAFHTSDQAERLLKKRYNSEARFIFFGRLAIISALVILVALISSIILQGYTSFFQHVAYVEFDLSRDLIDPESTGDPDIIGKADYRTIVVKSLRAKFPEVTARRDRKALAGIISSGSDLFVRRAVLADPSLIGTMARLPVPLSDDADSVFKGFIDRSSPEDERRVKDNQLAWLDVLDSEGNIESQFNWTFFQVGDSREPELAGIRGAVVGSFLTLIVTLLMSFPLGVATAIYLEEFAPKNRWTDLIEVNINNLAAVPSIVFGLLGLAVFLNFFGLPRSAPLVGGLVLALMTLPTIIIASRASLKAVPPSIREAGLGVGASHVQTVFHHVLPLAMPGMMTGTIIGMAQALGETAPLLMIGMVAFIVDVPTGVTSPATVLPVQIFIWADSPERAFVAKTAGAIMVLLGFLITMNLLAVMLRRRFERRW